MVIFSASAMFFYCIALVLVTSRLFHPDGPNRRAVAGIAAIAVILHAAALSQVIFTTDGQNFSLTNTATRLRARARATRRRALLSDNGVCRSTISLARASGLREAGRAVMRTTVSEVVVRIALLEQAREPVCERANVCRHFGGSPV